MGARECRKPESESDGQIQIEATFDPTRRAITSLAQLRPPTMSPASKVFFLPSRRLPYRRTALGRLGRARGKSSSRTTIQRIEPHDTAVPRHNDSGSSSANVMSSSIFETLSRHYGSASSSSNSQPFVALIGRTYGSHDVQPQISPCSWT